MFGIVSNMRSIHTESRTGLRAIVLGLLLVLIIGAFLLLFEEEAVSASGGPQVTSVVVEPGDTLWEIADRVAPESADLRGSDQGTGSAERVAIKGVETRSGSSGSF